MGQPAETAEQARVTRLVATATAHQPARGTLHEANKLLSELIRDASFALEDQELVEHLWVTALDRMLIIKPSYWGVPQQYRARL